MKPGVGLIGRKLGMTQLFQKDGRPVPVTVLEAGPCTVVQVKSQERDGYRAVQLGFGQVSAKRLTKPVAGRFAKANVEAKRVLKEFRLANPEVGKFPEGEREPQKGDWKVGDTVTVSLFKPGDRVNVTGRSLGKGFQGGMARWHWRGGPETHGSMSHRRPGSIGASTTPSRVYRGKHLPGHMGDRIVTTQALEVIQVDLGKHLLILKGAVPGRDHGVVWVRPSTKPPKRHDEPPSAAKAQKQEKKEEKPPQKSEKGAKKEPEKRPKEGKK